METFQKALRLADAALALDLEPLPYGDPRHVDLSAGRNSDDLKHLRVFLQDYDATANRFAKAVFTGHRGCGKTTELFRLMHDVQGRFTAILLLASDALLSDFDYSDLFLWLVDQLVGQFRDEFKTPLDSGLVADRESWFAEVTKEVVQDVKSELTAGAEAEVGAKFGWFGVGLKVLARLKSMVVGSVQRRQTIRRQLQRYSFELVNRVNLLLDNAHDVLRDAGKPANLLIVVDKLDRLTPEIGQRLFHENGDLLKRLRAHVLYTVPIASVLAPINIGQVFEHKFTLPMVRVRDRQGKQSRKAVENLVEVLAARLDVPKLFARGVPQLLARMSGGSVRDLVRLAQSARLVARADDKEQIDRASAERAITKLRIDYQQLLIPGQIYYPLLAQVHQTKQDWFADVTQIDPAKVEGSRKFFNELLFNGAVMEYDGGQSWYDVHPVIEGIEAFQKAQSHVQSSPPAQA